jgi:hypothetical protein
MLAAIGLMMAMGMNAQKYLNDSETPFTRGKLYVNAAYSGTALAYSKSSDWQLGIGAKAGYFFIDNLMGVGTVAYNMTNNGDISTAELGAGARWYFDTIGIYVGALAKYAHQKVDSYSFDDFRPEANVGYAFFLNRNITVEPEAYYEHSFKDSDYSGFGVRIGLSVYFNL